MVRFESFSDSGVLYYNNNKQKDDCPPTLGLGVGLLGQPSEQEGVLWISLLCLVLTLFFLLMNAQYNNVRVYPTLAP